MACASRALRAVNDCIYGMILTPAYAYKVIEAPIVQRLGRIRQLGNLSWAWPSAATHTRLAHSLGTLHLAETYSLHFRFKDVVRETFGLASLLHDIAHGPYSHAFETAIEHTDSKLKEIYKNHDHYRVHILENDVSLSNAISPEIANAIICIWKGEMLVPCPLTIQEIQICHALLAGVAGVDRLDYLLRDSYHTTPQRRIDKSCIQSIIYNTEIDWETGLVGYTNKGLRYVKLLMDDRKYMYREVYYHPRSIGADLSLEIAIACDIETIETLFCDFEMFDDAAISQLARTNKWMRQFVRGEHPELVREPDKKKDSFELRRIIKGNNGEPVRFIKNAHEFKDDVDEIVSLYNP